MKAEHRKELKTNALQAHLTSLVQGLKEPKHRPSAAVWVIAIVAIGTLVFFWIYRAHVSNVRSQEWTELGTAAATSDMALADQKLDDLVKDGRGTSVAVVAQSQKARRLLESGLQGLASTQRADAAKQLETARELYATVAQKAGDWPILKQQALLGEAKAEEALVGFPTKPNSSEFRGNLDRAIEYYKAYLQLADRATPQAQAIQKHVDDLTQHHDQVAGFYKELNRVVDTQMPALSTSASPPLGGE
ncbi:MAG TPA: hypothetical protein VFA18_12855 [Gemmataceae bacterium]|nr:hypothetical protein [Gemmataceae bacterium]